MLAELSTVVDHTMLRNLHKLTVSSQEGTVPCEYATCMKACVCVYEIVSMSMHETDRQTQSHPGQSEHLPWTEVHPRLRLDSTCLPRYQCAGCLGYLLQQPASARDPVQSDFASALPLHWTG